MSSKRLIEWAVFGVIAGYTIFFAKTSEDRTFAWVIYLMFMMGFHDHD